MYDSPVDFVKKILMMALYMTLGLCLVIFVFLDKKGNGIYTLLVFPFLYVIMFMYMSRMPDVKILKREKAINKEIVFAGRFLIIEISSGVSLYKSMANIAEHYEHVGLYFREILQKVEMGTSLADALNEEVELIPSNNLKRLMW